MNIRKLTLTSFIVIGACWQAFCASTGSASAKVRVIQGIWQDWAYASGGSALWFFGGDASGSSASGPAYMVWYATNSASAYAEIGSADINENWTGYVSIRSTVTCSSASAPVDAVFYDGANWLGTSPVSVSTGGKAQVIEWALPQGAFNWGTVKKVIFRVNTSAVSSGNFTAAKIQLLK